MILANDDRPRTMHAEAERTERDLLPDLVSELLERNDQRRTARTGVWQAHMRGKARLAARPPFTENMPPGRGIAV